MAQDNAWNSDGREQVPDGAPGNQAYQGIFYKNAIGRYQRLTEAEGHEVAKNPETVERNTIGMKSPRTVVRGFHDTFSKDILVTKGEDNYEFFKDFADNEYTGENAVIPILMIDFMKDDRLGFNSFGGRRYAAVRYNAVCTVDTENHTDGTLTVSFAQSGDPTKGIAEMVDDTGFPIFTPQSDITITSINLSSTSVSLNAGEEKWVSVSFDPIGSVQDFNVESDDVNVCTVSRIRNSVKIIGVDSGTTTVTVTNIEDPAKTDTIEVTVN